MRFWLACFYEKPANGTATILIFFPPLKTEPAEIMKSSIRSNWELAAPVIWSGALIMVLMMAAGSSFAAAGTWQGGSSGDWNTAANWTGVSYPTASEVATFNSATDVAVNTTSGAAGASILQTNAGNITIGGLNSFTIPTSATAIALGMNGGVQTCGNIVFNAPTVTTGTFTITQPDNNDIVGRIEFVGDLNVGAAAGRLMNIGGKNQAAIRFSTANLTGGGSLRPTFNTSAGSGSALEINVPILTLDRVALSASSSASGIVKIRAIGGSRALASASSTGTIARGSASPTDLEFDGSNDLVVTNTTVGGNAFSGGSSAVTGGIFTLWQKNSGKTTLAGKINLSTASVATITNLQLKGSGVGEFELGAITQDNTAPSSVTVDRAAGAITRFTGASTYTGATTNNAGVLLVNGSLAAGSLVVVNSGATLGGVGTIGGAVTYNSGSHAAFTNGSSLTLSSSLIIAASGTIPDVHVNLPSTPVPGDYTLATYNVSGSSGAFNSTPIIDSGSLGANTATIVTGSGTVVLHVVAAGGGAVATATTLGTSVNPSAFGQSVSFAATVQTNGTTAGSATSNYVFKVDGAPVATNAVAGGQATYVTSGLSVGSHTVVAEYLGDANYLPSTNSLTQTVNRAVTAVAVVSSSQTSGYKSSVSFTATLPVTAGGSVTFKTNGFALSVNGLSGGTAASAATVWLPRGTNTVTAEYAGDSNYLGSTNSISQAVTNHPPVVNSNIYSRNGATIMHLLVANLLTNATEAIDGDTLNLAGVGVSTNGVTLSNSGGYLHYYNTNQVADQFSYTVTDGFGGTNSGVITLTYTNGLAAVTGESSIASITGTNPKVLTAYGIINATYVTQRATNINQAVWDDIATNQLGASGPFTVTDSNPPPGSAYYRLRWQQP